MLRDSEYEMSPRKLAPVAHEVSRFAAQPLVPEVSYYPAQNRRVEPRANPSEVDFTAKLGRQEDQIKELQDQIQLLLRANRANAEASFRENSSEPPIRVHSQQSGVSRGLSLRDASTQTDSSRTCSCDAAVQATATPPEADLEGAESTIIDERDVSPDEALADDRSLVLGESATSHDFVLPAKGQAYGNWQSQEAGYNSLFEPPYRTEFTNFASTFSSNTSLALNSAALKYLDERQLTHMARKNSKSGEAASERKAAERPSARRHYQEPETSSLYGDSLYGLPQTALTMDTRRFLSKNIIPENRKESETKWKRILDDIQ